MRTFFKSFLAFFFLCILSILVIIFFFSSSVPEMLATNLTRLVKYPVTIADIELTFNTIELNNMQISNQPGALLPKAFSADQITLNAPVSRYLEQHIVIDEMDINNIYIGFEFDSQEGPKGNWTRIIQNAKSYVPPSWKKESMRTVMIRRLVFNNISSDVVYRKGENNIKHLKPIPQIVLSNISSEDGFPTHQIMTTVLAHMIKEVFKEENLRDMLEDIIENPPKELEDVEQLVEPFQLFK